MRFLFYVCLLITSTSVFGQAEKVLLHPNRGQWHENIQYKIELTGGEMYLEKQGFTYSFHNASEIYHKTHSEENHHKEETVLKGHTVRAVFLGSSPDATFQESDYTEAYRNYFLGSDQSKWKSNIRSAGKVEYKNLYPSIDMKMESGYGSLKYSFIVAPGKNAGQIKMKLEGAEDVFLDKEGNLHTTHSFGEIKESAPTAWTVDEEGKKTEVPVKFSLSKQIVTYVFPKGYNAAHTLVIDPQLTFSTFTGAGSDNWGFTAAPDAVSNVFAAGIVFGASYPVTNGIAYHGGSFDIGLTKFNMLGTALIYSTFIGGSEVETPHSIVCNANNELYIMGATSSNNFPMGPNPYQGTFKGGPSTTENGLTFSSGSDIFIARINPAGTLLSSSYIGGTGIDGINRKTLTNSLFFNYGDQFRGDITLDAAGNVYVASTSESTNFPVPNGFQTTRNGSQDAVIFKMSPNLSTMIWSTYFGGSGLETGNSIQVTAGGEAYIAGGTTSTTLGFPAAGNLTTGPGAKDGYVVRINTNTPAILSGTFIGTNRYDQAYFVQLDLDNKVYVYGQTEGNMPITPGHYGVPNSGQFIRKYSANLSNIEWTTTFGAGSGFVEISPTAFLVSDCYDIYISGWGGKVNRDNSSATHSSSNGFQVTPDAYQSSTNGSNFYIAVLGPDAVNLKYATFMGSLTASYNHVDGGTSRFDKAGRMYHAVCGACTGVDNGFTTTPGVWAPTNPSPNCNLAVFKFELNTINAAISAPAAYTCIPDPVNFTHGTTNGDTYQWDFGDNSSSNQPNPSHAYTAPGSYQVTLIVSDSQGCSAPDTTQITVNIGNFEGGVIVPPSPVCPGTPYELEATGGSTYSWSPANVLSNPNIANPVATVEQTTLFTVIISDSCGTDTLTVTLQVYGSNVGVTPDTAICVDDSAPLLATGGVSYLWSPATTLNNPNIANPVASPTQTTSYSVTITSPEGCIIEKEVEVEVILTLPIPNIPDDIIICEHTSAQITVSGADSYQWSPPIQISPLTGPVVTVSPNEDMMYYCDFVNACGMVRDSIYISLTEANISADFDTIICPGQSAPIHASGGISYIWSPVSTLNSSVGDTVIATPLYNTIYRVIGTDQNGCIDTAFVHVNLFPKPTVETGPTIYAQLGDIVHLSATGSAAPGGSYVWSPADYLNCTHCQYPTSFLDGSFQYRVSYTDTNGCVAKAFQAIVFEAIVYVPNTFTPDGSNFNDFFKAVGVGVNTFEMTIYNRWGELIKTLNSLEDSWDGTYLGLPCPDGTYVWKMVYTDFYGSEAKELAGHVNLLR